jgi:hypothetical protein
LTQAGLNGGDKYELINVMDFYNDLDTGIVSSGGDITVPMYGHTYSPVIGSNKPPVSQFPKFGVFIIRKIEESVSSVLFENDIQSDLKIFPNPSNAGFNVKFNAGYSGKYQIFIYDTQGHLISKPKERFFTQGNQEILIDTKDLPVGVYFIIIKGRYDSKKGRLLLMN